MNKLNRFRKVAWPPEANVAIWILLNTHSELAQMDDLENSQEAG